MATLTLGTYRVDPPVVLAPMAGITNIAYRRLCREYGAGVFVCEMVTSRALVERNAETLRMARFHAGETPRSLQLYGVDPHVVGDAVRMVVAEDLADHVDLNFGCPVPKVTKKGGGSALPYKRRLFRSIVRSAVAAADGAVPVTVKIRKGIDEENLTYLEAGRTAQDEGAAWVALHGRTAAQMYGGTADWEAISRLKASARHPGARERRHLVGRRRLAPGPRDGVRRRRRRSGLPRAALVVPGPGCRFRRRAGPCPPNLGEVAAIMRRHARLLVEAFDGDEDRACRDFRKHVSWYTKGFRIGGQTRAALGMVASLAELDVLLERLDPREPYPVEVSTLPRGRSTGSRRVALPDGWLIDPDEDVVPWDAELAHSGG